MKKMTRIRMVGMFLLLMLEFPTTPKENWQDAKSVRYLSKNEKFKETIEKLKDLT